MIYSLVMMVYFLLLLFIYISKHLLKPPLQFRQWNRQHVFAYAIQYFNNTKLKLNYIFGVFGVLYTYMSVYMYICICILRLFILFRFDIPRYSHVQHTKLAICNKLMYVDYYQQTKWVKEIAREIHNAISRISKAQEHG